MKKYLKNILKIVHELLPKQIHQLYIPLFWKAIYFLNHSAKTCFHTFLPVITFESISKNPKSNFKFVYVGICEQTSIYWANLAFPEGYMQKRTNKKWIWEIMKIFKKNNDRYDFTIIEMNSIVKKVFFNKMPAFQIPTFVHLELDIDKPIRDILKKRFRIYEGPIRKYNLSCETGDDPEIQKEFYYNMYIPFVQKRFGKTTILTDYYSYKKCLENGKLLIIKKDGQILGGAVLEFKNNKSHFRIVGIKDGNLDYMKLGVISALYYFMIIESQKKKYHWMHLGASRPLLSDGVTHYKLELNPTVVPLQKTFLRSLVFLQDTSKLREFLFDNSILYTKDGKNLSLAVFPLNQNLNCQENYSILQNTSNLKGISDIDIFFDEAQSCDITCMPPLPNKSSLKLFKKYIFSTVAE